VTASQAIMINQSQISLSVLSQAPIIALITNAKEIMSKVTDTLAEYIKFVDFILKLTV